MKACEQCGGEVKKPRAGRVGRFCSPRCRQAWRRANVGEAKVEKFCPWCEKRFETTNRRQECCSLTCSNKLRHQRAGRQVTKKVTCPRCRKEFAQNKDRKIFCSVDCNIQAHASEKRMQRLIRKLAYALQSAECLGCKTRFLTGLRPLRKREYCTGWCRKRHQERKYEEFKTEMREAYQPVEKKQLVCVICERDFEHAWAKAKTCSDPICKGTYEAIQRATVKSRRRARLAGALSVPYNPLHIFQRDNWTCQLCGAPCSYADGYPSPHYPTIDHIIALANGGADVPGNVQCACFDCNSHKGARDDWRPSQAA
jgi:hypothetical protein